ncbi:MAG TPA: DUF4180 domain-containing protein [Anaerovoracaceae bacterium]|nr:DUF4180 domain-containing protein [Anaerovoracaceae bacterium]
MSYQVIEKDKTKYISLNHFGNLIRTEADALELLSVCMENETNLLLIPGERLPEDFFQLSTGIAGSILQKFVQYGIKCTVVLDKDIGNGRFRDLLIESNRGNSFRLYSSMVEAESWLLNPY